jgi:hypothetical protein
MSKLLRYSIETDRTVLLSFSDDSNVRVPLSQVKEFVGPSELKKIEKALQIRENFFKRHLPKFAISFVAGGLLVVGGLHENTVLNNLFQSSNNVAPVSATEPSKLNMLPVPSRTPQTKSLNTDQQNTTNPAPVPSANQPSTPTKKNGHMKFQMPHLPHFPKLLP